VERTPLVLRGNKNRAEPVGDFARVSRKEFSRKKKKEGVPNKKQCARFGKSWVTCRLVKRKAGGVRKTRSVMFTFGEGTEKKGGRE